MKKWKPIVTGDLKKRLEAKLGEIAEYLLAAKGEKTNLGLMGGKPGVALFLAYHSRCSGDNRFADRAFDLLSETFDGVNEGFTFHTFAGGLAGIGWTVEHLVQKEMFQADTGDIFSELDPFLARLMVQEMQNGNYDYLHGALGVALYFLRRGTAEALTSHLPPLVAELEKHAEKDPKGLKWISILDREKGNKGYNLSLSHGQASIACILAKMLRAKVAPESVPSLFEGAVSFLANNALDSSKFKVNFPSWIAVNPEEQTYYSRLGWCYGDLGSASTLIRAAEAAGKGEWREKGIDVLRHTAQRRDLKENAIMDAGLCHGAAGVAHVFNRFFQETGEESLRDTALYWLEKTLELATFEDGIAGYKTWHTEKYGGWIKEPGFLEGVSGIGLALISAVSGIAPDWDESLLLI